MLVVRADQQPLYPHHIKVLLDFIWATTVYDKFAAVRARARFTPENAIEMFTAGGFKEFWMTEKRFWRADPEVSGRILELPMPFGGRRTFMPTYERPYLTERSMLRLKFMKMSVGEMWRAAETWRERYLIETIHSLREKLGENAGPLGIGPKPHGDLTYVAVKHSIDCQPESSSEDEGSDTSALPPALRKALERRRQNASNVRAGVQAKRKA